MDHIFEFSPRLRITYSMLAAVHAFSQALVTSRNIAHACVCCYLAMVIVFVRVSRWSVVYLPLIPLACPLCHFYKCGCSFLSFPQIVFLHCWLAWLLFRCSTFRWYPFLYIAWLWFHLAIELVFLHVGRFLKTFLGKRIFLMFLCWWSLGMVSGPWPFFAFMVLVTFLSSFVVRGSSSYKMYVVSWLFPGFLPLNDIPSLFMASYYIRHETG